MDSIRYSVLFSPCASVISSSVFLRDTSGEKAGELLLYCFRMLDISENFEKILANVGGTARSCEGASDVALSDFSCSLVRER